MIENEELEWTLKALLNLMIPSSDFYKMPSGADIGFEKTLDSEDWDWLSSGLLRLNAESFTRYAKKFYLTQISEQRPVIESLNSLLRPFFNRLIKKLVEFYYQHEEVKKALGLREGPHFPDGYLVDEGDLTLLESVYERTKIYREIPSSRVT